MNILIFGNGSKFGLTLTTCAIQKGHKVYGITGKSNNSPNSLTVDWNSCTMADVDSYLRQLPELDAIILNQNSMGLNVDYATLGLTENFSNEFKQWGQSFFVNCILPMQALHILSSSKKIKHDSRVVYMLSRSIMTHNHPMPPMDYKGQKFQNYVTMQSLARNNSQIFLGMCPGWLNPKNYEHRANRILDFVTRATKEHSGNFYYLQEDHFDKLTNVIYEKQIATS